MSDRALYMTRKGDALWPADKWSEDRLRAVPEGKVLLVSAERKRNPLQHRLLWALAAKIADNHEGFADREHVVDQLKFATGLVERRRFNLPGVGTIEQLVPKSISFAAMKQDEFQEWFSRALDYVVAEIWPGLTHEQVRAEIAEMIGVHSEA